MGRTLVVGAVPIVGDAGGSLGLFIGWGRIQHPVAVIVQVRWLQAAWGRGPAVEEEDVHGEFGSRRLRFALLLQYVSNIVAFGGCFKNLPCGTTRRQQAVSDKILDRLLPYRY